MKAGFIWQVRTKRLGIPVLPIKLILVLLIFLNINLVAQIISHCLICFNETMCVLDGQRPLKRLLRGRQPRLVGHPRHLGSPPVAGGQVARKEDQAASAVGT